MYAGLEFDSCSNSTSAARRIWGWFQSHSCSADSCLQGKEKRKMRRSARNRKTALRTESGQRKAREGQYRVGQNSAIKKKHAISILDHSPEPTRNASGLSLDSGRVYYFVHVVGSCAQKWRRCWTERQSATDPALLAFTLRVRLGFIFHYLFWTRKRGGGGERERERERYVSA